MKNKIDQLITNLSTEFSKIPNFEFTQTDSDANQLFNFVINNLSDIQNYKTLYKNYYIPAANKSIVDTKNEIKTSLYKNVLNVTEDQLKENYYSTILLGYVGLFHKVENFVKELLIYTNRIYNEGRTGKESIEAFYDKRYNFRFNDWYSDSQLNKINWISNCVKHYDGYPRKEPKYKALSHLSETEKIQIKHDEFYKDVDYIAEMYYQFKLSQILSLSLYKMAIDNADEEIMTDELRQKIAKYETTIKLLMT